MSTPPPDPYIALGVSKGSTLAEIRCAHRKRVLKCHPDKVQQDDALKAEKLDEFQKVQQAYELLSDDTRRTNYDDQVKLFELRKEMGRGNPTARSNPFEYEVRTAHPTRPKPTPPTPKVYSPTPPRSYEVDYDELRSAPRKTYESTDRKHSAAREEERRRREDDEKARLKLERETKRSGYGKKEKHRDKERRRVGEEKYRSAFVEEDDEEDLRYAQTRSSKEHSSRLREDELRARQREEARQPETRHAEARHNEARQGATPKQAPLAAKWDKHMDYAGQYLQASRAKVQPSIEEEFRPATLRRAETYAPPVSATYNVRHVPPQQFSDDESPHRSSASIRKESRKSAEAPPSRKEKSGKDKDRSRRSSPTHPKDPYIVEAHRTPTLQSHSSAPPNVASFAPREKPSRSKTQDYPRKDATPPLPRASTFHHGDRSRERSSGSRLRPSIETDESDSDSPPPNPRRSYSPPPASRQSSAVPSHTYYIIDQGRTMPVGRHRLEMRDIGDEHVYPRNRSESPRGGHRSRERLTTTRNHGSSHSSRAIPVRSQAYHPPEAPKVPVPRVVEARPPLSRGEGYARSSSRGGAGYYPADVKFAPSYNQDNVIYSTTPEAVYGGSRSREPASYYPSERTQRSVLIS
ncbi:DnaJ domain-containing protein [Amylocarpus encephaloides]|uniref:DnaJ domain-containing protein n=1 Tax=Amylocarpus encephaloides TaxID=45428 RepID=A0A9P7Y906_9HELO|nr:DnaJ domain-containing protein [Amylocarpus encephaloides]